MSEHAHQHEQQPKGTPHRQSDRTFHRRGVNRRQETGGQQHELVPTRQVHDLTAAQGQNQ